MPAALALALVACASHPRIASRIVDPEGRPIPGAVLYVETARPGGEFDTAADFAWAVAGADGEAPPAFAPVSVELPWRGMASLAALAPGFEPFVLHLRRGQGLDEEVIGLVEIKLSRCNPGCGGSALGVLSWPTFRNDGLRERSRGPQHTGLRAAFGRAWEEAAQNPHLSERERAKLAAQRALGAPGR